jgi:hypothetical protein
LRTGKVIQAEQSSLTTTVESGVVLEAATQETAVKTEVFEETNFTTGILTDNAFKTEVTVEETTVTANAILINEP